MNYSRKYIDQLSLRLFGGYLVVSLITTLTGLALYSWFNLDGLIAICGGLVAALLASLIATILMARLINQPLLFLAGVLSYKLSPSIGDSEPSPDQLRVGRELLASLAQQIYDLSAMGSLKTSDMNVKAPATPDAMHIFESIALPVIAVDKNQKIKLLNKAATEYFGLSLSPVGKALVDVANLSFPSEQTYESWLNYSRQNKVIDTHSWKHVRGALADGKTTKQFDMSASFMKDSSSGIETILAIFDQTETYAHADQETNVLAMAVHELRTPLTVMRGYIEVFEDELGPTLTPELKNFMHNMNASAQQLTAFVSNILNVARVESDQLVLNLREGEWEPMLTSAIKDLELRARVHDKQISLQIAEGLPNVAVDRVSIYEVINNLVENAIKYGGTSKVIQVESKLNAEGFVETAIIDQGVGIPTSVLPHLFEKYYRSHITQGGVGGTGLGLYLSKAIMNAHGGTLSAESHEGAGSTFRFGLQQYSQLKDEAKTPGQDGIMRGAHGWIKNHNLYRR